MVASAGERYLVLLADPGAAPLRARLLVVLAGGRARCHLVPPRRERGVDFGEAQTPAVAFAHALAQRIAGSRLESVSSVEGERVVRARFRGPHGEATLVAELFGADPNLLLVDAEGIVRCARRTRGGSRPLTVGTPYLAPTTRPVEATKDDAPFVTPPPSDPALLEFASRYPASYAFSLAYESLDRAAIAQARAATLRTRLRSETSRITKLMKDLERDLGAAEDAPRRRELADLVAANFQRLHKGQSSIVVEDLYRGGEVSIALDPALAPKDNLAKLYRGVERLERARPIIVARLNAARERAIECSAALELADRASDSDDAMNDAVGAIERLLGADTKSVSPRTARRSSNAKDDREPYRRFMLGSGSEVLVGRDDAGNDILTHRVARSHDIWLHVHGFHGSHVVLRVERKKSASLDDLLAAGQLAVHFSKRRGTARADVIYAEKKYVRKGRGKPGLALVERHKTLTIDHDSSLLAGLLGKDSHQGPP